MAGVAKEPGQRQSSSHIVALLSLKILLLAFFILLNALSSFEEERRQAVVDSVHQTFQGALPAPVNLRPSPSALDVFNGAEQVIEELRQLFDIRLPIVERRDDPGSWTLQVDVPVSELFTDGGQALSPEGAETLRLLADVLGNSGAALSGYKVELLHGLPGGNSGLDGHRDALARAGVLVRRLERQGLPPAQLSTGLLPSFGGQVRVHITLELPAAAGAEN